MQVQYSHQYVAMLKRHAVYDTGTVQYSYQYVAMLKKHAVYDACTVFTSLLPLATLVAVVMIAAVRLFNYNLK